VVGDQMWLAQFLSCTLQEQNTFNNAESSITNLHYRQLSSNILNYLAQKQTSISPQNMVCYANVRYVIEVKSHVNVCHVKIGHVKEFLVIFMGFIPMSRPVNVFYVNTKS